MKVFGAIFIVIAVIICAIGIGRKIAPVIEKLYLLFLEKLYQTIKYPTNSRHQKIENSKTEVKEINHVEGVHDLGQFQNWVDSPTKQKDITKLNNSSSDNLNDGCLNVPPEPIVKLISNPSLEFIHETNLSRVEKSSQPKGNDTARDCLSASPF